MTPEEIRGLLVFACTALLLGAAIGPAAAGPSAPGESPTEQELPIDTLEEVQSQQNASLEQEARQGVQEALTYLERAGVSVSEEYRNAALRGAIDAANTLEGWNDVQAPAAQVRQSSYGATIGALRQTEVQSVAAVADPPERVIDRNATSEIVYGATIGATAGAARSKSSPGDVPPAAVVDSAHGAASGSTQAVLYDPGVADLSGEATLGASFGALRGARSISGTQVPTQGPGVVIDPQPYVSVSAEGAARGTLSAVGDRRRGNLPPSDRETVNAASSASTISVLRATENSWAPDEAYQFAYDTANQSVASGQYAESDQ